jgi:hypothetical protein
VLVGLLGASSASAQQLTFLGSDLSHDVLLDELARRTPRRVRQVGTTSVTLRCELGENLEAAFKPLTASHPRGFAAEIAAYRIARVLGMDNVPPVVGRRLPRFIVERRLEARSPEQLAEVITDIRWDGPGWARGAAIYWVPDLRSTPLDSVRGLEQATPWLAQSGSAPEGRASLARDLSSMLAFDYLIANPDRFSGSNVSTDASGQRLYVRDHNLAFPHPLAADRYARVRGHLERVQRFSRSFVAGLSALDGDRLRDALAEDPESQFGELLSEEQIEGVLTRRQALLSYVAALVEVYGTEQVLCWR